MHESLEKISDSALILAGKQCPYCLQETTYVDSKIVYFRSYGMIYYCEPCAAWVGVHPGTDNAVGRLADKNLRELKKTAHSAFDRIWKSRLNKGISKNKVRNAVYQWLADKLGMKRADANFGFFDEMLCRRALACCQEKLAEDQNGMPDQFPIDRNLRSTMPGNYINFEKILYTPLKEKLGDNFWYDSKKYCYTFISISDEQQSSYYDYYPKANKVHNRKENKWIEGGWNWIKETFLVQNNE